MLSIIDTHLHACVVGSRYTYLNFTGYGENDYTMSLSQSAWRWCDEQGLKPILSVKNMILTVLFSNSVECMLFRLRFA